MKRTLIALALAAVLSPALRAAELQVVESVPEETVYGSVMTARPWQVWLDIIRGAKKTLDIEQFYIADKEGEVLESVLGEVKEAAKRGVKVRFIVDSVMMKESGKSLPALRDAGVEVRTIDFKKNGAGGIQHAKFFVADKADVFMGSQNFDWRSLKHIHEVGVRLKSARAGADFERIFDGDWKIAGGKKGKGTFGKAKDAVTAAKPETAVIIADTRTVTYSLAFGPAGFVPKGFDAELDALLALIKNAKTSLRGQVMTYALAEHGSKRWADLDEAFRMAAARGVKVELVFTDWGMGGKADRDIKALAKTDNIAVKISSLPQFSGGFIPFARVEHCKYLVADGSEGYVTTSNWGPGYFLNTRSAAVFLHGAAGAMILEDIFAKTWTGPYVQPVDPLKEYEAVKKG